MQSEPQKYYYLWFRLLLYRSPLLKESIVFFLFLQVLRCFSSLRSLLIYYFTHIWITRLFSLVEFPHSEIYGLMDICSYPQLIAAYHVLLRLLVPRHSPYALSSLTLLLRINFVLLCQTSVNFSSPYQRTVSSKLLRLPCNTCI